MSNIIDLGKPPSKGGLSKDDLKTLAKSMKIHFKGLLKAEICEEISKIMSSEDMPNTDVLRTIEVIYDGPEMTILRPKQDLELHELVRGTKWGENRINDYVLIPSNPLYEGEKYLIDPKENIFVNERMGQQHDNIEEFKERFPVLNTLPFFNAIYLPEDWY